MYENSAFRDFTTTIYAVKLYSRIVKISDDPYKKNTFQYLLNNFFLNVSKQAEKI